MSDDEAHDGILWRAIWCADICSSAHRRLMLGLDIFLRARALVSELMLVSINSLVSMLIMVVMLD